MARIFLDTNIFIDVVQRAPEKLSLLSGHSSFISPLSAHIFCHSYKVKVPKNKFRSQLQHFEIVDLSANILESSVIGPTADLEDNIQLHSAVDAQCDIFFTEDKQLLHLGYFGKVKIAPHL